ncbi:hypothetical protein PZT57_30700 [Pseudomonas aeruginosa]|uniref:hypothetical protein n=1 Tax=Pseudomonas aeruginosa TaxID=287 RepID=UPI002B276F30|nr:hypothetical protein [Pseudomonas aeruginosa]MEA8593019.1 hypothetical protein [Pseudomonas aeruginosa]
MSSTPWAEGPWELVSVGDDYAIYSADGQLVETVYSSAESEEGTAVANATLMAASPALFAALESALPQLIGPAREKARLALLSARSKPLNKDGK